MLSKEGRLGTGAYCEWSDARIAAEKLANELRLSVGVEKAEEYGRTVYRVALLPRPEHRSGWELRCEVVDPVDTPPPPAEPACADESVADDSGYPYRCGRSAGHAPPHRSDSDSNVTW